MPSTKHFTIFPTDGDGWLGLEQFRPAFKSGSYFSCQSHVSEVDERLCCQMGDIRTFPARILVRREKLEEAKKVLGIVYAYATPEQVDLKVMYCSH